MQTITGKYTTDDNFTTVYTSDNKMYTIASNGDYNYIQVGNRTFSGCILTQKLFDSWKAKCTKEGTFELE